MNLCPWDLGHTPAATRGTWCPDRASKDWIAECTGTMFGIPACYCISYLETCYNPAIANVNPTILGELLAGRIGSSLYETGELLCFNGRLVKHFVICSKHWVGLPIERRDFHTQGFQVGKSVLGVIPKTHENWLQSSRIGYTIYTIRFTPLLFFGVIVQLVSISHTLTNLLYGVPFFGKPCNIHFPNGQPCTKPWSYQDGCVRGKM